MLRVPIKPLTPICNVDFCFCLSAVRVVAASATQLCTWGSGGVWKKLRLIFEGVVGLGRHKELGEGGVKGTTNIFFMLAAVAVAKQNCVPFLLIMKPSLSSMVKMM